MALSPAKLVRRSVVMAQIEQSYGIAPAFNPATDAVLVEDCSYSVKMDIVQRQFLAPSISRKAHVVGKKSATVKFTVEVAMNDWNANGVPLLARLLSGCSMQLTNQNLSTMTLVYPTNTPPGASPVNWLDLGGGSGTAHIISYTIVVTTAGPSGTAQVSIIPHDLTLDSPQMNVTLTSGQTINIGSTGSQAQPNFSGNLVVGQSWSMALLPQGIMVTPVSTGGQSMSIQFYVDGSMHLLTGAYGTFSLSATGGKFATMDFEFTGFYQPYSDAPLPVPTYGAVPPPVFQSASLAVGAFQPLITAFTFDIGNSVEERNSANANDFLYSMIITQRDAKGSIDPEATAAANQDFWDALANASSIPFVATIGTSGGNRLGVYAPNMQYTGLSYKDRNSIRAYDAQMAFSQVTGDDEVILLLH